MNENVTPVAHPITSPTKSLSLGENQSITPGKNKKLIPSYNKEHKVHVQD